MDHGPQFLPFFPLLLRAPATSGIKPGTAQHITYSLYQLLFSITTLYIFLTVHLRKILGGNQLEASFLI